MWLKHGLKGAEALSPERVEIIYETSICNIPFGKHIVRQSFQLGESHVLHGMLYLANQFVSLVIVIIAQARCKSITHRLSMFNVFMLAHRYR